MIESQKGTKANTGPEWFGKVSQWYRDTAVIVLSTLILLTGFVLLSYAYFAIAPSARPDASASANSATFLVIKLPINGA